LLVKWGRLHAVRTALGLVAFATLLSPANATSINKAKESALRQDLFQLRTLISQYSVDHQQAPPSLEDLVTAGYMKKLPVDPMTGKANWEAVREDVSLSVDQQEPGIDDVHSSSTQISRDGSAYNTW
jgi:general secretion pathway protein G